MTLRPRSSLPPWSPPPNVAGQLIVLRLQPKVSSQCRDKALAPLGPSSQSLPRPLGEVLSRSPFGGSFCCVSKSRVQTGTSSPVGVWEEALVSRSNSELRSQGGLPPCRPGGPKKRKEKPSWKQLRLHGGKEPGRRDKQAVTLTADSPYDPPTHAHQSKRFPKCDVPQHAMSNMPS